LFQKIHGYGFHIGDFLPAGQEIPKQSRLPQAALFTK
jgi:hypothetical protein